jgi:hypothetical protein
MGIFLYNGIYIIYIQYIYIHKWFINGYLMSHWGPVVFVHDVSTTSGIEWDWSETTAKPNKHRDIGRILQAWVLQLRCGVASMAMLWWVDLQGNRAHEPKFLCNWEPMKRQTVLCLFCDFSLFHVFSCCETNSLKNGLRSFPIGPRVAMEQFFVWPKLVKKLCDTRWVYSMFLFADCQYLQRKPRLKHIMRTWKLRVKNMNKTSSFSASCMFFWRPHVHPTVMARTGASYRWDEITPVKPIIAIGLHLHDLTIWKQNMKSPFE